MPARFVEKRIINAVEELSPVEREQLRVAGRFYDGDDRPVEDRLAGGVHEGDGSLFDTELWKVVDGDRHLYDAWFYMGDSGTFFRAGTTEDVAMVIQSGLECEDAAVRAELGAGMVAAGLLPTGDSAYAEFAAVLEAQEGEDGPGRRRGRGSAEKRAKGRAAPAGARGQARAKQAAVKQARAKQATAKKTTKRATAKPAPAKKTTAKQATAKQAPAKKTAKRAAAKKTAKRAPAKRAKQPARRGR